MLRVLRNCGILGLVVHLFVLDSHFCARAMNVQAVGEKGVTKACYLNKLEALLIYRASGTIYNVRKGY